MTTTWEWEAVTSAELRARLAAICADVPARGKGRTSDHVETYMMRDVLWTAENATSIITYPGSIAEARTTGSPAAYR
jgi:hypothetical protein